jgi:hypothetical protein
MRGDRFPDDWNADDPQKGSKGSSPSLPAISPPRANPLGKLSYWLNPLSDQEIARLAAEEQLLIQHARVLAAEADRIEALNAAERARTALVEEANRLEREKNQPLVKVAILDYAMRFGSTHVTAGLLLEQSAKGHIRRDSVCRILLDEGGGEFKSNHKDVAHGFIRNRTSYLTIVQPWLDGQIDISGLRRLNKISRNDGGKEAFMTLHPIHKQLL